MNELDLFAAAIAASNSIERAALLDRECAGRPDLRRRLDQLLDAHARSNQLFDANLNETTAQLASEHPGEVVAGRYKLLELIGEGGMGAVWAAEQTQPVRRKVALKLIKAGMDSRSVLARFEQERQALALMDHPNIAKVLDGGLTDRGRPYFVMEYVKGVPITDYCDAVRLNVADRLALFVQVCHAVQHAHQKGIIHRDLKPSNILVAPYDDKPIPKIIDFGLAKAMHQSLTERTIHTAHESVLGTPLYMSPEQAQLNNLDVDTRSDVYSLGVLLYELLTGATPLERKRLKEAAWDEVRRLIREEEPPRPSTRLSSNDMLPSVAASRQSEPVRLTKLVRGELDWIVMKALEKDRTRRYETANGFAMDVGRYLAGEPVLAVPPSAGYRFRKFVQRHKTQVGAAGLVLTALLMGMVGIGYGFWQAETARTKLVAAWVRESDQRMKAEAAKAEAEANALAATKAAQSELAAKLNAEAKRRDAEAARQQAQRFHNQAFAALQAATGEDVEKLIGSRTDLNVNEREYLEAIIKRWQGLGRASGNDAFARYIQSVGHNQVARLWHTLGREDEAHAEFQLARDLQTKLVEQFPTNPNNLHSLALTHNELGKLLRDRDQWEAARVEHLASRELYERLVAQFPTNLGYQAGLATARNYLGLTLRRLGKLEESRVEHLAARDLTRRLVERFPADPQYQSHLAADLSNLALVLSDLGLKQEALAEDRSAYALRKALVERFPAAPGYQKDLAISHANIGLALDALGRREEALPELQVARDVAKKLVEQFPATPEYRRHLQRHLSDVGSIYYKLERHREALVEYQASGDVAKKLVEQFPKVLAHQISLGGSYCNCGMAIFNGGEPAASLESFDESIRILARVHDVEPGNQLAKAYLRNAYKHRALAHDQLENIAAASADWQWARALSPLAEQQAYRAIHANLAVSRLQAGKIAEAVAAAVVLTELTSWSADDWYNFSCVYAVASDKFADKKREYADRAMELLHKACKAGYLDAVNMKKDADLDSLRNRDDFKRLLAHLEAKSPPKKEVALPSAKK